MLWESPTSRLQVFSHKAMKNIIACYALLLTLHTAIGCIQKYDVCGCKKAKVKDTDKQGKRLECSQINIATMFAEADFREDIVLRAMMLRENNVEEVSRDTFGSRPRSLEIFKQVLKLDLSQNKIRRIMPRAFDVFPNLTRLNLSSNSIGRLSRDMFLGLPKLQSLHLSGNYFPIIPGDAFDSLPSLEKLFVKSTDLVCNCLMEPFISWLKKNSSQPIFKVIGKCHLPLSLQNANLRGLDSASLTCSPNNTLKSLPYFEMVPTEPQMAFEGDEVTMLCEGTDLSTSKVIWTFNGKEVDFGSSSSFSFNTTQHFYRTVVSGQLRIRHLSLNHSGTWNCTIASEHGKESRSLNLFVAHKDSVYCGEDILANEKGEFSWPETIAAVTTSLQCPISASNTRLRSEKLALRQCDSTGKWLNGKYDLCPFEDPFTRKISTLLQKNLNRQNVLQLVRQLVIDLQTEVIKEPYSVELVAKLLEILLQFINSNERENDLGSQILNLASMVMNTDDAVLREAQRRTNSCEKILEAVRAYALKSSAASDFKKSSPNIAVSGNNITNKQQYTRQGSGMSCSVQKSNAPEEIKFTCDMTAKQKGQGIGPFISLPNSLFDSLATEKRTKGFRLYFIAYRNGRLFQPKFSNSSEDSRNSSDSSWSSSSSMVLEAGVNGRSVMNLTHPAVFNFENPNPQNYYPAVWSPTNGWQIDDTCKLPMTNIRSNFTQIFCYKIANLTLLYDLDGILPPLGSGFSISSFAHPAVFVGSGILTICLLSVMLTYICCYRKLTISSDARHMLVNVCLHLLLLACAFTLGIWRVDGKAGILQAMCVTCGIVLHYSSLSVLLWITISARNIHREMILHSRPPSVEPKPPRPMLRFYLIGCGVPFVICGITAAAKMQNYDGDGKYCWLSWETSVFAFYLPAALIAIVCAILLIRVLCSLNRPIHHRSHMMGSPVYHHGNAWLHQQHRGHPSSDRYDAVYNRNISEDTPLQYMSPTHTGNESLRPNDNSSVEIEACNEQSYRTRLRGVSLLLFFFLVTWVVAALSVAAPSMENKSSETLPGYQNLQYSYLAYYQTTTLPGRGSYLSSIFSYVYAFVAIGIGVFMVVQHLVFRKDVRSCWGEVCSRCNVQRKGYRRDGGTNSTVSNTTPAVTYDPGGEAASSSPRSNKGKSSPKKSKKKHKEELLPVDPPTLETPLQSTEVEDEMSSVQLRPLGANMEATRSMELGRPANSDAPDLIPPSTSSYYRPKSPLYHSNNVLHSYQGHHHHHHGARRSEHMQQSPAPHSAYMMRHSDQIHSSPPPRTSHSHVIGSSSGHIHSHPHYPHEPCLNSRQYQQDPHQYSHYGHYHHHHGHHGLPQQGLNGKPIKLTNLQMAHDSSLTEHSLDDLAHNNMHTIPVVMQQHNQPKVDNSMLYNRYQKMRRALEQKRSKQRKLTVLREYAHDPLTSNDEDERKTNKIKDKNLNHESQDEFSPLIQSPDKAPYPKNNLLKNTGFTNYTAVNQFGTAENAGSPLKSPNKNGVNSTGSKYRMLLISSPTNRKRDEGEIRQGNHHGDHHHSHRRSSGARHKRGDSKNQLRHGRSGNNDRGGAPVSRRSKPNKRRSHNSTLSERERDTTSSGKSEVRKDDGDGLLEHVRRPDMSDDGSDDRDPSVQDLAHGSIQQPYMAGQESNSVNTSNFKVNNSGKDNHGYITLQQLMSAELCLPVLHPPPYADDWRDPDQDSGSEALSRYEGEDPRKGISPNGIFSTRGEDQPWHGDTDVSESRSQLSVITSVRNETSV